MLIENISFSQIAKAMVNYVPAEVPPNTYFSIAFMAKKTLVKYMLAAVPPYI